MVAALPCLFTLLAHSFLASKHGGFFASKQGSLSKTSAGTRTTDPPFSYQSRTGPLNLFWRTAPVADLTKQKNYENSDDPDFPHQFTGRAVLVPMLIRLMDKTERKSDEYKPWSIFGWTVGGIVALEYDESPVGPYLEYVQLGCLASLWHKGQPKGRFLTGQVGQKLFVNETQALTLCESVWNLQGYKAPPEIVESHSQAMDAFFSDKLEGPALPFSNLPLLWTPTITAIWAQLLPALPQTTDETSRISALTLNRLRVSGRARLVLRQFAPCEEEGDAIPLGVGVAVRQALIEISRPIYNADKAS